ncbi:MAG: SRPBCC family protein [Candidatus Sulfopaludibacter sp.]|nr:SRPBCC family protein [Candidatus Sulfopaludibacter sp.]
MRQALSAFAIGAGILVAALLGIAATRPNSFRVQRSRDIQAPPEKIFALIQDFRQWPVWSPYEKLDPAMTRRYSGSPSGRGAVYHWAGNSKAGEGRAEITATSAPNSVAIELDFLKPFEGHNTVEFTIRPHGDSTTVTWAMYGPQRYLVKVISLFLSMDRMMGREFEAGLANMESVVTQRNGWSSTAVRQIPRL